MRKHQAARHGMVGLGRVRHGKARAVNSVEGFLMRALFGANSIKGLGALRNGKLRLAAAGHGGTWAENSREAHS